MLMAVVVCSRALACASSLFFLIATSIALSPPFFLVPSAQGLAAKHEVVVFDDGRGHPGIGFEVDLVEGQVGCVHVRDEVRL